MASTTNGEEGFEAGVKAGTNPDIDCWDSGSTESSTKVSHADSQVKKTTKTKPALMLPTIKATVNPRPVTQSPSKLLSKAAKRQDQYKYLNGMEMMEGWT
jgi:hypothetical protein